MSAITINDGKLHKDLKRRAIEADLTLGKTIDKILRFGLQFKVDSLEPSELEELQQYMKQRGFKSLSDLVDSLG